MVTPAQGTTTALNLAGRASELLDSIGDAAGASRLRHAVAVIRSDAGLPPTDDLEVPVSLMRLAMAHLDRGDGRAGGVAARLQAAIDFAREAPMASGGDLDDDLFA